MNSQDTRHGIMITLGGTLIGALLYIFALSLDNHFVIITNYIIAMILYTCSFLAAFQQYKKMSSHLMISILILIIIVLAISTYSFVSIFL
ncbi:hypothetical protein B5E87_05995 [Massilimicrobiota sp. An142]|uniref:hypothetical protein n=1 Tax=Massilimicrobiota sp. An142 TaxID=1965564 RepID=UPI000B397FC9|nr:hypothetical protein [Massilimicrobiota sp. An142]OUQ13433.1 hypothetical protein B5E87_05995 [Massilimicrobiota sp. An142]